MKGVPMLEEANKILAEAEKLNPGPWVGHSIYTGEAAKLIAENCKDIDPRVAYILGILHDIGRRFGVTNMKHIIDGYNYSMENGWNLLARICLTHSFTNRNIKETFGEWDCSDEEYKFVENYLKNGKDDDYDKLIQLCDALALPNGFTLVEKRIVDVALRRGIHEHIIPKWKATFEIKKYFEDKMGKSIYGLLPKVIENTFEI